MQIVDDLIGVPFADGGRGPDAFDCWGLCREVYRRFGLELPDYALCCYDAEGFLRHFAEQRPLWQRHELPNVPTPAVVAIRFNAPSVNHVGVHIGEGKFLHTREKTGVVIELVASPAWRRRIEGFYTPKEAGA